MIRIKNLLELYNARDSHFTLSGADLSGADLSGASLSGADLSGAELSGADLSEANLSGANLSWANLSGANLSGANLSGANLSSCSGLAWASCGWHDHGERGRIISAVLVGSSIVFFCGCFRGSSSALRQYIADGDQKYEISRTRALEFLLGCF